MFLGVTFTQHIAFQLFKLKRNRLCLPTPVLKQPRYHSGFDGSKLSRVGQELESPPFASSKPEMGRLTPVRRQGSGRSTAADFTATNVTPDHQSWTLVSTKAEFSCCNDHIETWPKKEKQKHFQKKQEKRHHCRCRPLTPLTPWLFKTPFHYRWT